jgi:hypothetical protein
MSRGHHTSTTQTNDASLSAILASHLQRRQRDHPKSMDGRQPEYPQSGLTSPYAPYTRPQSEGSSADPASAVQYQSSQDYKSSTYSTSATPDSSYGLPSSARSGSFPEYIQRSYPEGQQLHQQPRYPAGAQSGMAQTSSPSPSIMPDRHPTHGHTPNNAKSDAEVPIDPSIAQSSPTYPPPQSYSPYPPQQQDMPQYASQPMTSYARPEWAGHYQQPMYGHSPATSGGAAPNMVAHSIQRPPAVGPLAGAHPVMYHPNVTQGGHPLSTVYSFVPIPGAQQHKRPRRRYEEIERMYKCGWNGCEKAYGTLNHLNAHVTMQSHGTKRTPEGTWCVTRFFPSPPLSLPFLRGSARDWRVGMCLQCRPWWSCGFPNSGLRSTRAGAKPQAYPCLNSSFT